MPLLDQIKSLPTQRSIPVLLKVGLHCSSIIAKGRHLETPITASWEVVNGQDVFGVVIGGAASPISGTLVGERYSRDILRQVIRRGGLPLPINYEPTDRDDDLMKLVSVNGIPAWDAIVVPIAQELGITVDPGVVAPNSSPGAPGVPPSGGSVGTSFVSPPLGEVPVSVPLFTPDQIPVPAVVPGTATQALIVAIGDYLTAAHTVSPTVAAALSSIGSDLSAGRPIDDKALLRAVLTAVLV
jgi:hypothetical protein